MRVRLAGVLIGLAVSVGLAAACGASSNSGLYVVGPDGGKATKVASDCIDSPIAWSPDGDSLAYEGTGGVSVVNTRTARTSRHATNSASYTVSWSPDGSRIVYGELGNSLGGSASMGPGGLLVTSRAGRPRRIQFLEGPFVFPAWSPDGKLIAFEDETNQDNRIAVVRPDGFALRILTEKTARHSPVLWFPDSKRLLFFGDARPGATLPAPTTLWIVNAGGSGLRRIATETLAPGSDVHSSISPDGKHVAYSIGDVSSTHDDPIYVINSDGSGKHRLAGGRVGGWSPDGKRLAFIGEDGAVYRINADGTGKKKIAGHANAESATPSWSSKGEIAYANDGSECAH